MLILRQMLFASKKQKSYRKQNRAAKKRWEEAEGNKILVQKYGGSIGDADAIAKTEVQLEKNGARTLHLNGTDYISQKKKAITDNPDTIEVKADEIARKKTRDRAYHSKEFHIYGKDYHGHNKYCSPEEQKEGIERLSRDRYEELKGKYRRYDGTDTDHALDLKDRSRKRKLAGRAEKIRKNKSLVRRIKEDLGIGMSKSAKDRFEKLNDAEDRVLQKRLKKIAENENIHIDGSLDSIFTPAAQSNLKSGKRNQNVVVAHDAPALAHEIGHAHFASNKKANKIGKISHKLYIESQNHAMATNIAGISSGVAAGINKAIKEEKGKKESTLEKLSPALTSLAVASPMLISEAAASRHGAKLLKEAGASRRFQNYAKKDLGKAWGSYAMAPIIATTNGYLAKGVSYGATKAALEYKNGHKKDKKK